MTTMPATKPKAAATKSPDAPLVLRQYLDGRWVEGTGTREIVSTNPADVRKIVARGRGASKADAEKALSAAQAAFPAWKATPAPQRGRILAQAAQLLRAHKEELARLMTREEGKIYPEALGEMEKGITLVEWFAGEGLRLGGVSRPSELARNLLLTMREPLGVVSVITPWNFPFAIPAWKLAPALVAGNSVVFKPASLVPAMAVRIVEIFAEAGLPPGVLNLVIGAGSELGDVLVEDPRVKAVSFTGSNEVGSELYAQGARRMKKCQCEMGGKNPLVILSDADLPLAMESAAFGAFASTGQRCTATSRVIIEESVADKFVQLLVARASQLRTGNGLEPGIDMGPAVDESQLKTDLHYIEIGKKEAKL
ncbi:MAG: aldehyde dehydrogenase family protein, partial [Elusimicrobia bacterium]|nr:aldehyde dehydrogenase family protein [Elusimicrobiota bacterium]